MFENIFYNEPSTSIAACVYIRKRSMKKLILSLSICSVLFTSCSKEEIEKVEITESTETLQSVTNISELVKPGQPNCIEPISSDIKIKVASNPPGSSTAIDVNLNAKTVKQYPTGGYILVYELNRTNNVITVLYKQVHTSCSNPATQAFASAASTATITQLAAGTYPIEIKVGGHVNKGSLVVPQSLQTPQLLMQTTNGIIIE
jgi:hypothetical protein